MHPNTGKFIDGFGSKIYAYAVGNPIVPTEKNRYKKAHQKGRGFGLVIIHQKENGWDNVLGGYSRRS